MEKFKTKHYEITCVDCELTKKIISLCAKAYQKNKKFFGRNSKFFKIYIVDGEKEFKKRMGKEYSPAAKGKAHIGKKIVARTQESIDKSYSKHGGTKKFELMITHEIAHIFDYQITRFKGPFWFRDSLAMHVAGQVPGKNYMGPKDISQEKAASLMLYRQINDRWRLEIYTVYHHCLKTLMNSFGEKKVIRFISSFPEDMKKKDFEKLFERKFGIRYKSFINDFIEKAPWIK